MARNSPNDRKIQAYTMKLLLCLDTFTLEDLQELQVAIRKWEIERN